MHTSFQASAVLFSLNFIWSTTLNMMCVLYFKTNKSPVDTFLNKYKIGCVINLDDVEDLEFVVVADLDDVVDLAHDC